MDDILAVIWFDDNNYDHKRFILYMIKIILKCQNWNFQYRLNKLDWQRKWINVKLKSIIKIPDNIQYISFFVMCAKKKMKSWDFSLQCQWMKIKFNNMDGYIDYRSSKFIYAINTTGNQRTIFDNCKQIQKKNQELTKTTIDLKISQSLKWLLLMLLSSPWIASVKNWIG